MKWEKALIFFLLTLALALLPGCREKSNPTEELKAFFAHLQDLASERDREGIYRLLSHKTKEIFANHLKTLKEEIRKSPQTLAPWLKKQKRTPGEVLKWTVKDLVLFAMARGDFKSLVRAKIIRVSFRKDYKKGRIIYSLTSGERYQLSLTKEGGEWKIRSLKSQTFSGNNKGK